MSENYRQLLGRRLAGAVYWPGDEEYVHATTPNNAIATQQPSAVVAARRPDDVSSAIRAARLADLKVAVQATGHGAAGTLEGDALLVDTSRLDSVEVDTERRIAVVGAGATSAAVNAAAEKHGWLAPTGTAADVCVSGYFFHGGVSWFTRPRGLASRHLRAVEFVDGHGNRHRADEQQNVEALWAFRGGGGVGIATSLEIELLPSRLWAGYLLWPVDQLDDIAPIWHDAISQSESVTSMLSVMRVMPSPAAPTALVGQLAVYLGAAAIDGEQAAEGFQEKLKMLPTPTVDTRGPCDAARIAELHFDPPRAAPGLGDGGWLTGMDVQTGRSILSAVGTDPDWPLIHIELRHVAVAKSGTDGALVDPPGPFLLHSVGAAPDSAGRARVEAAERAVRREAVAVDTGRDAVSFRDGRTSASEVLDHDSAERLRAAVAKFDPEAVFTFLRPVV